MVNLRDYTAGQEICLLLNLEKPAIRYDRDLPEEEIRLTYTLAAQLIEARLPVALRTNGRDLLAPEKTPESPWPGEISLASGSAKGHLTAIAEALARIDLARRVRAFDTILDEIADSDTETNVTFVLVSSARGDALRAAAARLAARQNGLFWLAPLETDMPDIPMPPGIIFERIDRKFQT